MPLNNTALDAMADHLATLGTHLAIHTADPGTTGLNRSTAGLVPASWGSATSGGDITTLGKAFTGGESSGPVWGVGLWDSSGTTFYGGFQIPNDGSNDLSFNAAGDYTLNSLTVNGASS